MFGYIASMASVVHVIVGLGNGGAEKTLLKVVSLDSKNRHTVISLAGPGHHGGPIRAAGGHVHCMGLNSWNLFQVIRRMNRLRCLGEADIIASWMPHAILLLPLYWRSRRARLVINIRASSYGMPPADYLKKSLLRLWYALFGKKVDVIITPGYFTAVAHRALRLDKKRLVVIPNGFGKEECPVTTEGLPAILNDASHRTQSSDVFRIGMFARWHPVKNHLGFLEALSLLLQSGVDFRVVMAGVGISWKNRRLARAIKLCGLEDKVELLGPFQSLREVCEEIDVHVVASSYGEAFPNVVAETMLEGIPNVVTNVGDSSAVLGGTGWLVEPGDKVSLYKALKDAEASRGELHHKGKLAAERIRSLFPISKMVDSYSELFEDLAS